MSCLGGGRFLGYSLLFFLACGGCAGRAEQLGGSGKGGSSSAASAGAAASSEYAGSGGASNPTASAGAFGTVGGETGAPPSPPSSRCHGGCAVEGPRPVPTPRPVCPQAEPTDGAACDTAGLTCTYGDSASVACRRSYDCTGSQTSSSWLLDTALQASFPCTELPSDYCPKAPPAELTACTVAAYNTPCVYGVLVCYCGGFEFPMDAGASGKWGCSGPPADLACPASLPNIGEGCASEGTECDYADGCLDPGSANVLCHDGAWQKGTPFECLGK